MAWWEVQFQQIPPGGFGSVALSQPGLQSRHRAGVGEHSLGAAQGERADLRRRGACLGGVEQWLGEGQSTLHLGVAFDSQAGVTGGHIGMVALLCST